MSVPSGFVIPLHLIAETDNKESVALLQLTRNKKERKRRKTGLLILPGIIIIYQVNISDKS
jgi:predicted butyrate kinase (DUF1464 family)